TTPRADIYSLGAILHQMLTGEDPAQAAFYFPSVRQKNAAVPEVLEQLITGMVALDVNRRPESIEQIRSVLHALDLQQRMQYGLPSSSQFPRAPYTVFPAPSSLSSLPPPPLSSHYPAPGNFSAFGAAPHPAASPPHPTAPGFGAFGASPGPSYRSASVQSRPRARQIQIQQQAQLI